MHINVLDNDYVVFTFFCNCSFQHFINSGLLLVPLSYYSCLLVWESVGQIIPEQDYSQESRLFFAFSVSGWRVQ